MEGAWGYRWGFTTRRGGVSAPPYDALNLGGAVGDDPAAVAANRSAVAATYDVPPPRLIFMAQCHGTRVVRVDGPWEGDPPACDAVVTTRGDVALAALVADCTPVLLVDPVAGVAAAVHAGRPGMTDGVVGETVGALRDLGARDLRAVVGPAVCGRCYEVPQEMVAAAARRSPVSATVSWTGTPAVDVAAGVVDQLVRAGVAVDWVPGCAREDPDLYSYRGDGLTGRSAGVVRLLAPTSPEPGGTS
nr:polyphenol oxidase family protein [Lapillicoccus jejuensis]